MHSEEQPTRHPGQIEVRRVQQMSLSMSSVALTAAQWASIKLAHFSDDSLKVMPLGP